MFKQRVLQYLRLFTLERNPFDADLGRININHPLSEGLKVSLLIFPQICLIKNKTVNDGPSFQGQELGLIKVVLGSFILNASTSFKSEAKEFMAFHLFILTEICWTIFENLCLFLYFYLHSSFTLSYLIWEKNFPFHIVWIALNSVKISHVSAQLKTPTQ